MKIEFPNLTVPKITALGSVSFQVRVEGEFIWCEVSFEALMDHFCSVPTAGENLLRAFEYGRTIIEETARRHLELNDGQPILLMSDDFLASDLQRLR